METREGKSLADSQDAAGSCLAMPATECTIAPIHNLSHIAVAEMSLDCPVKAYDCLVSSLSPDLSPS